MTAVAERAVRTSRCAPLRLYPGGRPMRSLPLAAPVVSARRQRRPALISRRILRISAVISRRRSITSIDRRPCRHMPLPLPRGAPGEAPPCRRHRRRFFIAGDRQGVPARVRASQRGQDCANGSVVRQSGRRSTGLPLTYSVSPSPFAGSLRSSFPRTFTCPATMACPPSPTLTCCTTTVCCPPLRTFWIVSMPCW
jgi:hypothetical protein